MKAEQISDALNLLADSVIEETGSLRQAKKRRGGVWRRWAAAAACLCVVAVALAALPRLTGNEPGPLPTSPVQNSQEPLPDLPSLILPETVESGMGFESYLLYDISELVTGSPWEPSMELTSLPVYKNGSYHEAGMPVGLDEYAILERLEAVVRALDTEIQDTEYEQEGDLDINVPEGTGPITSVRTHADGYVIAVNADGSVTVTFDGGLPLPEDYRFTRSGATDEEAEAALSYLSQRFSRLLGFSQPQAALSGDHNFDGTFCRVYAVYDAAGSSTEDILNHAFRRAVFFPDNDGNLAAINLSDRLACADKLGDYPIITADQARELLLNGSYITSASYEMPGEAYIGAVELVYRNSRTDKMLLPYYRFYVELPEEARDNGLKCYGAYYVPAVEGQYIQNMPVYDGRFN